MSQTLGAIFDGEVLRPDEPISLKPNTHVRITIELAEGTENQGESFLDTALSIKLDGPSDWSEKFKDYLYNGDASREG